MPESSSSPKGPLGSPPHQMPHYYHPGGGQGQQGKEDKRSLEKKLLEGFDQQKVHRLHLAADTDSSHRSSHHTLGPSKLQAAPGDHSHRLIGIWLYRSTATNHGTNNTYLNLPWDKYKFWDQEYYAKNTNAIITVLKAHTALITYRVTWTGTAGGGGAGGTGRRGVRLITASGNTQTMELASLGGGTTNTIVFDVAQAITLDAGEPVNVDFFQNCGGTLDALAGLHATNLKIVRTHPKKIDSAGLSTSIVPQIPGPDIASRKFLLDGNW